MSKLMGFFHPEIVEIFNFDFLNLAGEDAW
jgi:hypothetical protein